MTFVLPLPKSFYEEAKQLGVKKILLEFSGGSDEGYLEVSVDPGYCDDDGDFSDKIEDWAQEAYSYGGAGDGNAYGDNVTYDLEEDTVTHDDWYTSQQHNGATTVDLEIADGE
jgi:hypothetical protein